MDRKLWEDTVEYHGHICPGIAMGFKVCEGAIAKLDIDTSKDKIVCIVENNKCPVDAVRFILNCTERNGRLIHKELDKQIFSFFNKTNGKKIKIELKSLNRDKKMDREEFAERLINADLDEVLIFTDVDEEF